MKGRQIYWHILQDYKVTDVYDDIHDFQRLMRLHMHEDNLQRFMADWDGLLLQSKKIPEPSVLKALFLEQIKRHPWLRQDMYDYN